MWSAGRPRSRLYPSLVHRYGVKQGTHCYNPQVSLGTKKMLRALLGGTLAAALSAAMASAALASEFDGWSVRKITHDKRFVKSSYSLSMARNGGGPKAKLVYHWIGFIPTSDERVYFDSHGEGVTCVKWDKT